VDAPIPFSHGGNNFGSFNGFGSTTDGLFAVGAGAGSLNALYSVDPTTGLVTLMGSTGRIPIGLERFQQTLLGSSNQLHLHSIQHKYVDWRGHIDRGGG
jgi:hypothetical protein